MLTNVSPQIPIGLMHTMYQIQSRKVFDQENGGKYRPAEKEEIPFSGVVLPISDKDLQYSLAGTYTKNSCKIYTNGHSLPVGGRVQDPTDEATYTIKQELGHNSIHPMKRYVAECEDRKNDIQGTNQQHNQAIGKSS